jgi:hypothetical protein
LAVTEFALAVTGVRPPQMVLNYRGRSGKVTGPSEEERRGFGMDCYYCNDIRGKGDLADAQRYLRQFSGGLLSQN